MPRIVRVAVRCLPIDARRPASWLGLLCAVGAGAVVAGTHPADAAGRAPPRAGALVAGAAAALAAIGDVPGAVARPRPQACLALGLTASRTVWPIVGGVILAVAGWPGGVWITLAIVLAASGSVILRRAGADAAEAVGATLLSAGVAATCAAVLATGTDPVGRGGMAILAAVAAWGAVTATAVAWLAAGSATSGSDGLAEPWAPTDTVEALGWPAGSGRLGGGLLATAMIAALVGMAGWLFLAPERSGWYAALAACCFVAVAVPRATLAWGAAGGGRRSRLLATVPAGPGPAAWLDRRAGTDPLGPEWRVPVATAALLAWPPLVAAGVVGGAEAVDRWRLVAHVVGWGLGLSVLVIVIRRAGAGRETALAVALAAALAWWACVAGPIEPSTPRNRGGNGVEESGASCETPRPRQAWRGVRGPVQPTAACNPVTPFEHRLGTV